MKYLLFLPLLLGCLLGRSQETPLSEMHNSTYLKQRFSILATFEPTRTRIMGLYKDTITRKVAAIRASKEMASTFSAKQLVSVIHNMDSVNKEYYRERLTKEYCPFAAKIMALDQQYHVNGDMKCWCFLKESLTDKEKTTLTP